MTAPRKSLFSRRSARSSTAGPADIGRITRPFELIRSWFRRGGPANAHQGGRRRRCTNYGWPVGRTLNRLDRGALVWLIKRESEVLAMGATAIRNGWASSALRASL